MRKDRPLQVAYGNAMILGRAPFGEERRGGRRLEGRVRSIAGR